MKKAKIFKLINIILISVLNLISFAKASEILSPLKIEKKLGKSIFEINKKITYNKPVYDNLKSILLTDQQLSNLQNTKINIMSKEIKPNKIISFKEYKENYSRYQTLKSEGSLLEIRLDKEEFNHNLEIKNKHFQSSPTDYCLTNMIGEDMNTIRGEDVKDLSKPLKYSHLIWDLYWSFGNGGFDMFIEHYDGNDVFGIVEALNEIGLKKESEALNKVIMVYHSKMQEKYGKIIGFRAFNESLIENEDEYDAFNEQFENEFEIIYDSMDKLYIYGDKYLLENLDKFII
jgi:hypothetical protein